MIRPVRATLICLSLFVLSIPAVTAQDTIPSLASKPTLSSNSKNPNSFWRRLSVGGQIGFQFGTVTGIVVSPDLKIRTIDQLFVGVRLMYEYFNYRDYYYDTRNYELIDNSSNVFGGGLYLRYYLRSLFQNFFGNLFAHVEYEYLFYTIPFVQCDRSLGGYIDDPYGNSYIPGKEYIGINSFFVGGGLSQPIAGRVFLDFMVLFNLNDSYNSPYTNPIIRIGVGVGL